MPRKIADRLLVIRDELGGPPGRIFHHQQPPPAPPQDPQPHMGDGDNRATGTANSDGYMASDHEPEVQESLPLDEGFLQQAGGDEMEVDDVDGVAGADKGGEHHDVSFTGWSKASTTDYIASYRCTIES